MPRTRSNKLHNLTSARGNDQSETGLQAPYLEDDNQSESRRSIEMNRPRGQSVQLTDIIQPEFSAYGFTEDQLRVGIERNIQSVTPKAITQDMFMEKIMSHMDQLYHTVAASNQNKNVN